MNNLENLTTQNIDFTEKIASLIESLRITNPDDIKHLDPSHASLLNTIFIPFANSAIKQAKHRIQLNSHSNRTQAEFSQISAVKPKAETIFVAAPSGAGKDSLVRRIKFSNPDAQYIVLNMDMFRHYHHEITGSNTHIQDEQYAETTNQTSYEIYFLMQELLLREFPGTNVIITGTMRNLAGTKEIINRYKTDSNTNFSTTLAVLAVPYVESAFSIFERYLEKVDLQTKRQQESQKLGISIKSPKKLSLRYTSLKYHDNTTKSFAPNIETFESELRSDPSTSTFNRIKVYRRALDISDPSENTLVYDSQTSNSFETAARHVRQIMSSKSKLTLERIQSAFTLLQNNKDYLESQGLYQKIFERLNAIRAFTVRTSADSMELDKI